MLSAGGILSCIKYDGRQVVYRSGKEGILIFYCAEEGEVGFFVEFVGDDYHEFCGEAQIFFDVCEKVFVGER